LLPIPPSPNSLDRPPPGDSAAAQASAATRAALAPGQAVTERKLGYFEFEPDVAQLLAQLIPLYSEASIYAALLEASASEHASRQRAMSAATENAEELLKTLTRVMNRARQDSITTEIMEIVGGSEALRSAGGVPQDLTHPQATEEQNP
jgi:F-type H+-transporting ATPase subunit gamma